MWPWWPPYYLPEDTVNALQEALADYGEDRNGDGKVVVTLNVYTLDYAEGETQTESDAYLTMAGTTKLAADVQGGLSSVFLLWDPAGFEESTGSLRYLDGTLPAADSDEDWWNMVYRWDDCPVLDSLDLGDYGPDTTQSRSGSSQEYMSQFYVGMRGAWNSGTADNLAGGEEFWQKLTEGAVTATAVPLKGKAKHLSIPEPCGADRVGRVFGTPAAGKTKASQHALPKSPVSCKKSGPEWRV